MAEKTRIPPSTDLLMKDANTAMSDRAKRINSLHKKVDQIVVEENRKRRQVSTEVDSLSKQKERLRRELEYARTEISHDMAKEYGGVVKGLGKTIHQLSIGVKNITMTTAKATSDAVSQYGKAISEDISINKTNMMAMALAKTSPLFGYFASKFMETDVFKGAAARIRDGLGSALVSGIKRVSGIIPGIEGKREKQGKREREISALTGEIGSLKKEIQGRPPAMQVGGFVRKGGVVEVHAAEVITPVDKLLREISTQIQIQQAAERRGFVKTFVKEFQQAKDSKQENWQDRMLKSLIELKIAFIGTTSRLRIAWQRTLLEHPTFRGMLMFAEGFKAVIGAPIKWLFGARGGYLSDIKRASATDNVFLKTSNILGLIYTMGMPKLDAIAKYTRATATAVSGVEPSEPLPTRYSMFQRIGAAFRKQKKTGKFDLGEISGKPDLEKTAGKYGLHAESLREAGLVKMVIYP